MQISYLGWEVASDVTSPKPRNRSKNHMWRVSILDICQVVSFSFLLTFQHLLYRSVIPLTCHQPMPCKDQEGGNTRRKFLISTKELLSPLTPKRVPLGRRRSWRSGAPAHPPISCLCWCLCTRVCRIRLSAWKRWETRSSPVSDKSYHTNVLARTSKTKKETFIPCFRTAVKTCQTSLFHNNNKSNNYSIIINNNSIQTNLDKLSKINWKHVTAAYNSGFA